MKKPGIILNLYLIMTILLAACGANSPTPIISKTVVKLPPTGTAIPEFQKGISYTTWWHGNYSSEESDNVLSGTIKPMKANWISILVTCYQDNIKSVEIQCLPDTKTPTDGDLAHAINYAHSLGLKVMLKPHLDLNNDDAHWRGDIGFGDDEAAWDAWFASYDQFILHYADLAQKNNADYFVIGTELAGTSKRIDQWRSLINKVRTIYKGPLTYAANWGEVFDVYWWNDLDTIGVDAYYPLTNTDQPSLDQLKEAWKPIVARLGSLSVGWKRPIIITEIGYRSIKGANRFVDVQGGDPPIDLQEQADCYQAVFEAFRGQAWWRGVYWWNWSPDPNDGGPQDNNFTANNKPAENILRANYGAPPRAISAH